jgi:hypothetical protein
MARSRLPPPLTQRIRGVVHPISSTRVGRMGNKFATHNPDMAGSLDPEADAISTDAVDRDANLVTEHQFLADSSTENEHCKTSMIVNEGENEVPVIARPVPYLCEACVRFALRT